MAINTIIKNDNYLPISSLTLKQYIKDRMTEQGVFIDANYEGSNISALIDIFSYTIDELLYYLNKTSSETMFSDASIYENISRITKLLGYSPIGKQTSVLPFIMTGSSFLPIGLYTIPKYSFITLGNSTYSFNENITFSKTIAGQEVFTNISNTKLLYEGKYIEYPVYTAIGQDFEVLYLTPGENVKIDHFNVDVYVKKSGVWEKYERTPSLYLNKATDKMFEIRYNENKNYEIKFGDDINCVKLNAGDSVAVYYLRSDGTGTEVGVGSLKGMSLTRYTTPQFTEIFNATVEPELTLLPDASYATLSFDNTRISTYFSEEETVDDIKINSPKTFRSQYRLVTSGDYETYIKTNYSNMIHDIKVFNNWDYISNIMKYYHDLGIASPSNAANVLYSQVQFSDACNFNNIYIIAVPKKSALGTTELIYLSPAQKELIMNGVYDSKTLTSELIVIDPIYMSCALCIENSDVVNETIDDSITQSELIILKDEYSRRDNNAIKADINTIVTGYFARVNSNLGQTIDIDNMTAKILAVDGVKTMYTRRKDNINVKYNGLSFRLWNSIYSDLDNNTIQSNVKLANFKFPYLYNSSAFLNQINVSSEIKVFESIEY